MSSTNTSWSNESNTKADSTIASTVSNVNIAATSKLYLDGGGNTYLTETSADLIDIYAGAAQVLTIASSVLTINEGGSATVDFRIESDGEDEALFMDASANTLYINKGETAFTTSIHSTNDVAMTIGSAGVVFNEDGHATNDFRVETDTGTHAIFVNAGSPEVVINDDSRDMDFRVESTSNTGMFHVDSSSSRVGVGTSVPSQRLEVADPNGGVVSVIRFDTVVADTELLGGYYFSGLDSSVTVGAKIEAYAAEAWTGGSATGTDLVFSTVKNTEASVTESMRILDSGNVGIGTAAPAAKLHVAGQFAASHTTTGSVTAFGNVPSPSVSAGNIFKTYSGDLTISMFDDGVMGQIITVISQSATTYDVTSTQLKGGSTDIVTASGDVTQWVFDGTNWYLLSWMDVSADLSGAGGF